MIFEVIALCVLSAGAGDWPQFRGPNSDGHAVGPATPVEWSDTKNVVWKTSIPGLGWSSPVVVDGKVFLTTAVPRGEGLSLRAMAFDAKTGKTIWDREVRAIDKAPSIHTKNSHASPTPLIRDGSVFVHFGAQGMAR
ncbi:MAG: PQQ-binding-like beta-propeller repeat protein, partial [Planctomycetaceae bacterium]|nr:PQQ-binding-like beta-propeller repeat protein [Planctomycetaceae bacterium]